MDTHTYRWTDRVTAVCHPFFTNLNAKKHSQYKYLADYSPLVAQSINGKYDNTCIHTHF